MNKKSRKEVKSKKPERHSKRSKKDIPKIDSVTIFEIGLRMQHPTLSAVCK